MAEVSLIEAWPKNGKEIAYHVKISGGKYRKKPFKWFYGEEKIFPATTKVRFGKYYGIICRLIREAHMTRQKVSWSPINKSIDKGAKANELRGRLAGACE